MTAFCRPFDAFLPSVAPHDGQQPLLAATVVHANGAVVVHTAGEMDLSSTPRFERDVEALFALSIESVTIDLRNVTFCDSAGLRTLSTLRRRAEEHGVAFALRAVPRCVQRVLDITERGDLFVLQPGLGYRNAAMVKDGFG